MRCRAYLKVVVRLREVQVLKDEVAEFTGVVLVGVDECVGDVVCDAGTDEWREFDDFGTGAEYYNYFIHLR